MLPITSDTTEQADPFPALSGPAQAADEMCAAHGLTQGAAI
jgi:hypothetical protein